MRPFDNSRRQMSSGSGIGKQFLYVSDKIGQSVDWLPAGQGNRPDRVLRLIAVTVGANRDDWPVACLDDDRR